MLTEAKVLELLNGLKEPFLHKTLEELNAIQEVKINEEKAHVSVKIAIAKTGTAEQLQLQSQIVSMLKQEGANTVGLRFSELPEEVLAQYRNQSQKEDKGLLSPNSKTPLLRSQVVKVELVNQQFPLT